MAKGQFPTSKEAVDAKKIPKITEKVESYFHKNPSWQFSNADMEHQKWSVLEVEEDIVDAPGDPTGTKITHNFSPSIDRALLDGLMSRENAPWSTWITQSGGRKIGTNNHNIPVYELVKEAQQRVTELNLDTDVLFSLRLGGTKRVFGILEDGVLRIIWFDRNHEICPPSKS